MDNSTLWRDVFDTLTSTERACIGEAAGAELEEALGQGVVDDFLYDLETWPLVAECLSPQTIQDLLFSTFRFGIAELARTDLDTDQEACLRRLMAEADVAAVFGPDDSGLEKLVEGALICITPSRSEATAVVLGDAMGGVLEHDLDLDWFVFEATEGQLYDIRVALGTVSDSEVAVYDADGEQLAYNDDDADSMASRLWWEAPTSGEYYIQVSGFDDGSYTLTVSLGVDDHANAQERATTVVLGDAMGGVLEHDLDLDWFVFEATEGQLYDIQVALGTLSDSEVAVYDADGEQLAYNDDDADSWASRLWWEAPASGEYYIEVSVSGSGSGSYTLTVSLGVDDHANAQERATTVVLGEAMGGVLEHDLDLDWFVFEATEGQSYDIQVALGTLSDSEVAVYDADGELLAYNDDDADSMASRLWLEAPASGEYYIQVSGYDDGSYTMTVAHGVDDHADTQDEATAVVLGEVMEGLLEHDLDLDWFVFEATEGQSYDIQVALGTAVHTIVKIYNREGEELALYEAVNPALTGDADSLAASVSWEALTSGEYFIEMSVHSVAGSYTLTVAVSEDPTVSFSTV